MSSTNMIVDSVSSNPVQQYHNLSSTIERQNLENKYGELRFALEVKQQPKQSRMCGVGEKNNRRPIDPPPAVLLHVNDGQLRYNEIETMSLFLACQLVFADSLEPVTVPGRERQMSPLVGVTNTTMHRIVISPDDRAPQIPIGVFAFTDLSVRQEGNYRLRFFLFEIRDGEAVHLTMKDSDPFKVYAAKGFPGMEQSTPFTDILKKHGIRVRVSKSIRATKKLVNQVDSESTSPKFDPEDDSQRRLQLSNPTTYQPSEPWRDARPVPRNEQNLDGYRDDSASVYYGPTKYVPPAPFHPPPPAQNHESILPLPLNVKQTPTPLSPTAPGYDREYDRRGEYVSPTTAFPGHVRYNDRRDPQSSNYHESRWRSMDVGKLPRHSGSSQGNGSMSIPFSPPPPQPPPQRQYSPSVTLSPFMTAQPRQSFSPRPLRQPDYPQSRRYSTSQQTSLPPLHFQHSDLPSRDLYNNHDVMQDVRVASHSERPNGMAYTGEQFQPPPTPVPLPEWQYYNSSGNANSNMGYQNGTMNGEGYRG